MRSLLSSKTEPLAECRFCSFLHGESHNEPINTPWLRGLDYSALVSVGAMVPGWSLVCPNEHDVNLANHYSKKAFWDVCTQTESIIRNQYGAVRVFEHGAQTSDSMTGCGTGHAHLHFVPLQFPLAIEGVRRDSSLQWTPCRASEIAALTEGSEYLFVADEYLAAETKGLLCKLETPQSQFFRKIIAQRLGMGEFYNYKHYPMLDIALASWHSLRAAHFTAHENDY